MTATSLEELRVGEPSRKISDEKMDQVRELLVGEDLRRADNRLQAIESRLQTLETEVARRIDAMQARLEALSGEVSGERRASFDELAQGIADLGQKIKAISRI